MTEQSPLERRYRRWLALYPRSFRADHEEEMVAVLMQGADPGRRRPRGAEMLDLAVHGLRRRAGRRFPGEWERSHAKVMFPLRVAIIVWLSFITTLLVAFHRGEFWLVLLLPAIALHAYIAYQIRPTATRG